MKDLPHSLPSDTLNSMEILRGVVERITYHNEETGYTVAKLAPERRPHHLPAWQQEIAIIGNMMGIAVGESVELSGQWTVHPEYGKQFTVEQMRSVLPATVAGLTITNPNGVTLSSSVAANTTLTLTAGTPGGALWKQAVTRLCLM